MLYRKSGMPEADEIVICTVTKVYPHSVFVMLDEYDKSGMIHISEVSPGRIRNIRDYVREGRKIVCKVLKIHLEKGHIDLSLRRVNEAQRKKKLNSVKQEQKAEKILEIVAREMNTTLKNLYEVITEKVFEKYDSLNSCFFDVVIGKISLSEFGFGKELEEALAKAIKQRIKVPEVQISANLFLTSYDGKGVNIIKEALLKAKKAGSGIGMKYLGSGKYSVTVKSPDYKTAETLLKKSTDAAMELIEKHKGTAKCSRK